VGKWAARLAEKTAALPKAGTDETDKRGLLSVLAVVPRWGAANFQTAPLAVEAVQSTPALPDVSSVAWTDADIASFQARRDRLARWGWTEDAAEALAARLVQRDRAHDERVCCADCSHYRPGVCRSYMRAGLQAADLGRDLAGMLQRCPAFNSLG
jgi:hypothetical protein